MRAVWKNVVFAGSDETTVVEGNHYFPAAAVKQEFLRPSQTTSVCPWKGTAHYFDLVVGDQVNADSAWCYPEPKEAAAHIKDHMAFWRGVDVREDGTA